MRHYSIFKHIQYAPFEGSFVHVYAHFNGDLSLFNKVTKPKGNGQRGHPRYSLDSVATPVTAWHLEVVRARATVFPGHKRSAQTCRYQRTSPAFHQGHALRWWERQTHRKHQQHPTCSSRDPP
uniref:Putative glutathione s-transferase kappa n=1 Tax=Ixodes ricinus TaxID=34613 RepID=A0A0K8RBA8_IXORI